jgi:hypothetical protein
LQLEKSALQAKSSPRAVKSKLPSRNFPPKLLDAFYERRPVPAAPQERRDEAKFDEAQPE